MVEEENYSQVDNESEIKSKRILTEAQKSQLASARAKAIDRCSTLSSRPFACRIFLEGPSILSSKINLLLKLIRKFAKIVDARSYA